MPKVFKVFLVSIFLTLACQLSAIDFARSAVQGCSQLFYAYPGVLIDNLGPGEDGGYLRWDGNNTVRTPYHTTDALDRYLDDLPSDLFDTRNLANKTIVDVGSHNGAFIFYLIDKCNAEGVRIKSAFALDIEPSIKSEYIVQGDFFRSNIPENSVDILVSSWSVFYYEARNPNLLQALFVESQRILRNGGRLIITPLEPKKMPAYTTAIKSIPGLTISSKSVLAREAEPKTNWGFLEIEVSKQSH